MYGLRAFVENDGFPIAQCMQPILLVLHVHSLILLSSTNEPGREHCECALLLAGSLTA